MPGQGINKLTGHAYHFVDRVGKRYGRLTVIEYIGKAQDQHTIWKCQCDCGNIIEVAGSNLRKNGHTKSCGCLRRDVSRNNGLNSRQYELNESVFEDINTPDKAYWLGFILADGCIVQNVVGHRLTIVLKESDIGHLEKFAHFLDTNAPIKRIHYYHKQMGKTYHQCRINISSKRLVHSLVKLEIYPNKSLNTKSIHDKIPPDYWRDYWRGIVDGDGCLDSPKRGQIRLTLVGDDDIIKNFLKFCHIYIDFVPSTRPMGKIFTSGYCQKNASIISGILYSSANIYLDRKYKLAMQFVELYRNLPDRVQLSLGDI